MSSEIGTNARDDDILAQRPSPAVAREAMNHRRRRDLIYSGREVACGQFNLPRLGDSICTTYLRMTRFEPPLNAPRRQRDC